MYTMASETLDYTIQVDKKSASSRQSRLGPRA